MLYGLTHTHVIAYIRNARACVIVHVRSGMNISQKFYYPNNL